MSDLLNITPARVRIDGQQYWRWPGGKVLPVVSGGDGPDDPPQDPPPDDPPAFTPIASQDEFDRMVAARLQRERSKFADYDELKGKAERLDALEAEQQSDLEREQAARAAAEAARDAAVATAQATSIRAAITSQAAGKVQDVDAAVTLILAEPDTYAVTIDDAGRVTGADTAVSTLLTAKPFLAAGPPPPPNLGQGKGRGDDAGKSGLDAGRARFEQRYPNKK